MKDYRPRIKGNLRKAYDNITKKETRVLVIGDSCFTEIKKNRN